MKFLIFTLVVTSLVTGGAQKSFGAPKPPASSTSQLPQKLPPKKKTAKRTYIDMSNSAGVVIAPKDPNLNKAFQKSIVQKTEAAVRVQSRVLVPAPPGDLSEIPSIAGVSSSKSSAKSGPTIGPTASPAIPNVPSSPSVAKVEIEAVAGTRSDSLPAPLALPPMPIEPMTEFSQSKQEISIIEVETVDVPLAPTVSTTVTAEPTADAPKGSQPQTLAFVRTGYLQAKYGKFDSRMKDGATYVGLGFAREFETTWGSFEARASMDAYHAMDQSVTVDNIRMLATRTEVGYWFTRTRVRPGISLGLGWTDYSVRSYRSVGATSSATNSAPSDPSNQTVVLKTHAKAQAFTVIPGTSLRIEIAEGLVIDTQTEFLGILGGDSAEAVQGLSFGIGLGWIF